MKNFFLVTVGLFLLSGCSQAPENENADKSPELPYQGKKILYVNSYHWEPGCSAKVTQGIHNVLDNKGITLKEFWMDTKHIKDLPHKKNMALKVKKLIEEFKPDVVIVAEDNAFKYIVKEHFRDAEIPFVFLGVNWDINQYEGPYSNTTGMLEVSLFPGVIKSLREISGGNRIGYLAGDMESERKIAKFTQKIFDTKLDKEYYAKDFAEWKKLFLKLQDEVDMIWFENNHGIKDWNEAEAIMFIRKNLKVPIGTTNDWMIPYVIIGLTKVPQEEGEWAATTALEIIDGKSPSQIPITHNKEGNLMLNFANAKKLGIVFQPTMIKNAQKIVKE